MTRSVGLLLPVLGLALVGGATAAVRAVAGPPPAAAAAPAPPAKAKLTAWRAGARPPAPVPPTAIVRAAKRDRTKDPAAKRQESEKAPEPVEIIWHAPGS
jgi:hypothetical protein